MTNPQDPDSRQKARQKRIQKIIRYGGLSGTGIGVSGVIYLLANGKPEAAIIAGLLTICVTFLAIAYKFVSSVINRVLDKIEEELESIEEPIATWIVNQPKKVLTSLWWWRTNSQFQKKYYRSLSNTFRDLKIEGFRTGLPVLDLENVFVSLRVTTEIPEKIAGAMISSQNQSEKKEIWDFLDRKAQKRSAFRRLAVIAPPGAGKTTLLKHLTLIYAQKPDQNRKTPTLIPVLLYLRDIRHLIVQKKPPNLPQLIREHIENLPNDSEPLNPPEHWIKHHLKVGKFLVMLDGLDEVADAQERTKVSLWVNQQMRSHRRNVFILSSRPHGYRSAPVEEIGTVLEVLPFNSEQVEQFIQSWYLQTEIMSRAGRETPAVRSEAENNAIDLIERIQENRAIADMAKNPLLVTMIATVHYCGSALPGRRVELYQKICDLLLGSRQKAKKIESALTAEQSKSVLQVLALALMTRKTREFDLKLGQELIKGELKSVAGNSLSGAEFLRQIKELSGLIVERELGVYEFAHLSFQEYLAAAQIKESQQEQLLIDNFQESWWAETIRLYAAQGNASNLISQAIEQPTVNSLILALDCLEESLKVEPVVREQLEEILEAGLESAEPQIAELAAQVKLSRRLNSLFAIDETLEIDTNYLTCAEYQLFVNEWLHFGDRFQAGSASKPITGISYPDAMGFCCWLTAKAKQNDQDQSPYFYRLPTALEASKYPTKEQKELDCWIFGENKTKRKGIRLIKTAIANIDYFEVIKVNSQGQKTRREYCYSSYFKEDLGNNVTLEMVSIPGGKFLMGSLSGKEHDNEKPQHEVSVKPFYMAKYQITQAQWQAVMGNNPSAHQDNPQNPVERVSWNDAQEFCKKLSAKTGKQYRLPNEAEWEYACRAGTTTPFYFGETITGKLANYRAYQATKTYAEEAPGEYRGKTTLVGIFPPNAFGLYDMHGNVWEWCEDGWHKNYQGAPANGSAWLTTKSTAKVLRGGSYNAFPWNCGSAYRDRNLPDNDYLNYGFRLAVSDPRTL